MREYIKRAGEKAHSARNQTRVEKAVRLNHRK